MPVTRPSCMFLLATLFTGILSSGRETLSKAVCLEDPVKLFEHVSLANRTIIINHIYGGVTRQIGKWFIKDSTIHFSVDKEFERIISLDKYGTVWIRKVKHADEGTYTLLSREDTGAEHIQKMELIVLEEPSNHCKPNIQLEDTHLIAFLNVNACGRPAASAYWLGFNNQTSIKLQPEQEAGPYHACIRGPSLRCIRGFKASDFCSTFSQGTFDKEMLPRISLAQCIADGSILLKCQSNYNSSGRIRWRLNGIPINNNAKYFQEDEYLTIRRLNNQYDDQYNIYTCSESGGRSESYPYSIETYGPSFVKANPSIVLVKEKDKLNVSCLTDCYPLCSVEWYRLDQSSGQKNVFSKDDVLQIANVTRMMSGNYSCKVQNPISGAFLESSFSLDVHYGPYEIFFNTSTNVIEVDEFDSITILCSAECFPPCLITWTEMSAKIPIVDAELKLVNVSNNGTYTCLASNKKLDITKTSQTISIVVKLDETLIPKIGIVRRNVSDSSVVLQCHTFRKSKGKFSWMINGSIVKHSDRYSPDNDFLYVRHVRAEDQTNLYTCREPGSKLQSDPFWIKASGPTSISFNPKTVVVREHDGLNVNCLADCSPLCSFQWFKLDPSSSQTNIFSEENTLQMMDVTREKTGNYSCKVQNIITGAFHESSFSLDVIYGPNEIVLKASDNETEVYQFTSTTVLCSADCFPPCIFQWTSSYTNTVTKGAELSLANVTSNGSLTCLASNPMNMNATFYKTIDIMVKPEGVHQTTSIHESEYRESTHTDIPSIRYLLQVIPGIGGIGIIAAVACILRKKYISRSRIAQVSNLTKNKHSHTDDSHQEETLLQHYWTIVTNVRGEAFTDLESNVNVELTEYLDPAIDITPGNNTSKKLEACSLYSDPIAIETSSSESVKSEGYINPVHSSPAKSNEYINPRWSHHLECNAYIHPVPSGSFELGGYADPTPSGYMANNASLDDSFPSHIGKHDEYTADAVEHNTHIVYVPSENVKFD